jgi:hypothetical protein
LAQIKQITMKKFLTTCTLISGVVFGVNAQIFINTGNPNMDKYKNDNPDAVIWEGKKDAPPATTPSTPAPTKTVKVVTPEPVSAPKTSTKVATESSSFASSYTGKISDANDNLPPNAEPGKCYARCFIPDQFEFKDEMVIDKALSFKAQTIPAKYKTVFDTVITRNASIRYNEVPAVYETITEDIMVSPATEKWVKSTADAGCLSANPADCQVMCLQQIPAVYKKVTRRVVKAPAYKNEVPVPAEFKIVSRQVVDVPAQQVQIEVPATYKRVVRKELSKKGGYSDWREILCSQNLTLQRILAIQQALKAAGYNPGPLDDVFGSQTKTALVKYQQDKGLPTGNLNMETLRSLGVE